MTGKRIAIVGGGGAGVTAAWRLSQSNHVTLFEVAPQLGGHAHTVHVDSNHGPIAIDTGAELITDKMSPNFYEIIRLLQLKTYVTPLSFGASFGPGEYWQNDYQCSGPLWRRIAPECSAFHEDMGELLNEPFEALAQTTIGEFVQRKGYTDEFVLKALLPIFSTFSGTRASLLDFSLAFCATSFNEGLLSFFQPPLYRKIRGGFSSYMVRLLKHTGVEVRTGTPVKRVQRDAGAVHLLFGTDKEATFDEVILATHADISLSLLEDATAAERELLGHYSYNEAECVVHSDESVLCRDLDRRPGFEYRYTGPMDKNQLKGSISRNVAITNYLDSEHVKLFVTLNPETEIDAHLVIARLSYKHAKLRPTDMAWRRQFSSIQGSRRTWYCGMDTTITGHEGSVTSALVIAEALGVPYPFAHRPWSLRQYDIVKAVMGMANSTARSDQAVSTVD